MTDRYDPGLPILGTTLEAYRGVLAACAAVGRPAPPEVPGIEPSLAALVVDDADARGLLGPWPRGRGEEPPYGPTAAGWALLKASALPRMSTAEAEAVLERLLADAAAMNADPSNPHHVERIWLFGSLARRGAADYGDVDVAVEMTEPPDEVPAFAEYRARAIARARETDAGIGDGVAAAEAALRRAYLGRATGDPRLAAHPIHLLTSLRDCPCRMVFDRARGGRVRDPLLPRHPLALPGTRPRTAAALPDMSLPSQHVPVHARHAADDPEVGVPAAGAPAVDGRRLAILEDAGARGAGGPARVRFERALEPGEGTSLHIGHAAADGGGDPDGAQVDRLARTLASACALDLMRMARIGLPAGPDPCVSLSLADGLPEWAHDLAARTADRLEDAGIRTDCPWHAPVPAQA